MATLTAILALSCLLQYIKASPITIPLTPEGEIDKVIPTYFGSKGMKKAFHKLSPNETYAVLELDLDLHDSCDVDYKLQWSVNTGSAIYSTPVIFPAGGGSDMMNIFIASYFNYVELLEGDGRRPAGWPLAFEESSFQSSPLVYDIDNDGNTDIGVVDRNGNLFWIRIGEFGTYLEDYHVQIPKLRVLRNWWDTVKENNGQEAFLMISMFDRYESGPSEEHVFDPLSAPNAAPSPRNSKTTNGTGSGKHPRLDPLTSANLKKLNLDIRSRSKSKSSKRIIDGSAAVEGEGEGQQQEEGPPVHMPSGGHTATHRRLSEGEEVENILDIDHGDTEHDEEEEYRDMYRSDLDMNEFDLPMEEANPLDIAEHHPHTTPEEEGEAAEQEEVGLKPPAMDDHPPFPEGGPIYAYDNNHNTARSFDDGMSYYTARNSPYGGVDMSTDERFIAVDPHILATPAMADLTNDGHMEIIFPVSYYFDSQEYIDSVVIGDVEINSYIASALVCWDMANQEWSWTVHLDLTTTKSQFQGLMFASPTIADLDGDGRLEVISGTALGMLYVIDGQSGFVRHGFPLQFHSLQAPIAAADIVNGPQLELVVCDMAGTVALLSNTGDVLWDRTLSGSLPFAATIGDVDGDNQLDIIVVAVNEQRKRKSRDGKTSWARSHVYALKGSDGTIIEGFPLALPQEQTVSGSVILWSPSMNAQDEYKAVYLLIPAYSGELYTLRLQEPKKAGLLGRDFCAQRLTIGSPMTASPLLEDVTGDGYTDLVVSTLTGEVLVFATSTEHSSAVTWASFPRNRGLSFSVGDLAIVISQDEKQRLKRLSAKGGDLLMIEFTIIDSRCPHGASPVINLRNRTFEMAGDVNTAGCEGRKYTITATKGSSRLESLWSTTVTRPGKHQAMIPLHAPQALTILLSLTTEFGLYAEDNVNVKLATDFTIWIKYFIMLPVATFCLLAMSRLPSLTVDTPSR